MKNLGFTLILPTELVILGYARACQTSYEMQFQGRHGAGAGAATPSRREVGSASSASSFLRACVSFFSLSPEAGKVSGKGPEVGWCQCVNVSM